MLTLPIKQPKKEENGEMDIQEAIEHLNDVLMDDDRWTDCTECKEEHEQLREWLAELQRYHQIGTLEECFDAMETRKGQSLMSEMSKTIEVTIKKNCEHINDIIEQTDPSDGLVTYEEAIIIGEAKAIAKLIQAKAYLDHIND